MWGDVSTGMQKRRRLKCVQSIQVALKSLAFPTPSTYNEDKGV
jgi:hypothetical protein